MARGLLFPEGMKAARQQAPFRLVTADLGPEPRSAPQRTGWLVRSIVAAGIATSLFLSVSPWSAERRAIRSLPDPQRLAVLARTVDELRASCGDGRPDALSEHCRELASFASRFDECRGDCATLVRRQLAPVPTR